MGGAKFLSHVTIPAVYKGRAVTTIIENGFASTNIKSITIPDSVTSIGERAFYYCSSLTSIVIPNSVTLIGKYAFYNCSKLTSVSFENTINWWLLTSSTSTSGSGVSSTSLANTSTAATYLTSTYYNYYWKRG